MASNGHGLMYSAVAMGIIVLLASPFTWIYCKQRLDLIEAELSASGSVTLRHSWGIAGFSMAGFMCLSFLAQLVEKENKSLHDNLIWIGLVFLLFSILGVIYERIRSRKNLKR